MLVFLLICNVLFIPMISGNNSDTTLNVNNSLVKETTKVESGSRKTNFTIVLEGGSEVQTTPAVSSHNSTSLLSLDTVLDIEKSIQSTGSKVTARKGVSSDPGSTIIDEDSIHEKQLNNTNNGKKLKDIFASQTPLHHKTKVSHVAHQSNMTKNRTVVNSSFKEKVNKTETHRKPLILSSEVLDKIPVAFSSSSTNTNQKQSSHPGMVMPVVITILVVPMFAVLVYMALRRGREAWKNRHYKRMDFLLDGMYNE